MWFEAWCGERVHEHVSVYVYMSGSRRLQQYSSLRLALYGAVMCDADMGDVVGGKRRQRNDTVYYWDKAEGKAKKTRVERYSTKNA